MTEAAKGVLNMKLRGVIDQKDMTDLMQGDGGLMSTGGLTLYDHSHKHVKQEMMTMAKEAARSIGAADWLSSLLAWLLVSYMTLMLLVVLAEATRAAMGLAAFGAEPPWPQPDDKEAPPDRRYGRSESFVGQQHSTML